MVKGIRLAGGGPRALHRQRARTVVDGPFTGTTELVAAYWIWRVRSVEEALEWVRRCPDPMPGEESEIEIRPRYEAVDFA